MPKPRVCLGADWMDDNDVRSARERINRNRAKHGAILRAGGVKLAEHEKSVQRSLKDVGGMPNSKSIVNKALASRRRELASETSDQRKALMRELAMEAERVRAAAVHYKSPMHILMRASLGSDQRSRLMQQVEHSGPVELASMAEYAAAKRDGELAAALCGRVGRMNPSDRPFSPNELADVICGDIQRELSQTLVECERRVLEALQDDAAFERGERNAQRTLQIAMLKKREAEIGAYQPEEEDRKEI